MKEGEKKKREGSSLQGSFVTGAIALIFLIIGYEVALFVHKAAVTRIEANRDAPDTVYIVERVAEGAPPEGKPARDTVRKTAPHSAVVQAVREKSAPKKAVESFRFNPNTVSVEDLQRLGFSEKQALSIDHYRAKGGRFRRKADFAKSYVVADSVYARLEPYIDIPLVDINRADSAALLALPGIGPWYAGKIVAYRKELCGYSCPEQLLEIYRFDREKFDGLKDLISCSAPDPYPLWSLPEEELSRHPYISRAEARGIVLYRSHNAREALTVEGLKKAGVLSEEHAGSLGRCLIEAP